MERIRDKEKERESSRRYYAKHREEITRKQRKYREENKEKVTSYHKKYRADNIERLSRLGKEYRDKNKEKIKQYMKNHNSALRKKVIEHYGGRCVCCNETTYEFLAIDHINNDGNMERKKISSGNPFYKHIIKNNFPDKYQILCHNCNSAKAYYGICPHKLNPSPSSQGKPQKECGHKPEGAEDPSTQPS